MLELPCTVCGAVLLAGVNLGLSISSGSRRGGGKRWKLNGIVAAPSHHVTGDRGKPHHARHRVPLKQLQLVVGRERSTMVAARGKLGTRPCKPPPWPARSHAPPRIMGIRPHPPPAQPAPLSTNASGSGSPSRNSSPWPGPRARAWRAPPSPCRRASPAAGSPAPRGQQGRRRRAGHSKRNSVMSSRRETRNA